MKTIKIADTNITITVTNAREMYTMFFKLGGWYTLIVDNDTYPRDPDCVYMESYFQKKYFN